MLAYAFGAVILTSTASGAGQHLFPGAVTNSDHNVGYFIGSNGGIQAVNLGSGQQLWSSNASSWPLEIIDGKLVAAAPVPNKPNAFQISCLEANTGALQSTSDPVALPVWAKPVFNYDEQPGYAFDLSSESFDNHIVLLRWSARAWNANDKALKCNNLDHKRAGGLLQVDTQTGRVGDPLLRSQPRIFAKNLLYPQRPDPTNPQSVILGPNDKTNSYSVYLSQSLNDPQPDKHTIRIVAMDPETNTVRWQLPLGTRTCADDSPQPR